MTEVAPGPRARDWTEEEEGPWPPLGPKSQASSSRHSLFEACLSPAHVCAVSGLHHQFFLTLVLFHLRMVYDYRDLPDIKKKRIKNLCTGS